MDDNLDRIFSDEPDVVPSAAFVRNVLAAVRREAATPKPISFPWMRAIPGLAICIVGLMVFLAVGLVQFRGEPVAGPAPRIFVDLIQGANNVGLGWIVLALAASLVPTRLVLARKVMARV